MAMAFVDGVWRRCLAVCCKATSCEKGNLRWCGPAAAQDSNGCSRLWAGRAGRPWLLTGVATLPCCVLCVCEGPGALVHAGACCGCVGGMAVSIATPWTPFTFMLINTASQPVQHQTQALAACQSRWRDTAHPVTCPPQAPHAPHTHTHTHAARPNTSSASSPSSIRLAPLSCLCLPAQSPHHLAVDQQMVCAL